MRRSTAIRLATFMLVGLSACESMGPPETGELRFSVQFLQTPAALASLVAKLVSTNLPTQATVTITLTTVDTTGRHWSGGPTTVPAANYDVTIEGKDIDDTVTYRGGTSIVVGRGTSRTFAVALACVHQRCEAGSGDVSLVVITPQLEVEPNDQLTGANHLNVFSVYGGRWQVGLANGRIAPTSDLDAYTLELPAPATAGDSIVVVLFQGTDIGSTLTQGFVDLFDGTGAPLGGTTTRVSRAVSAGTTFRARVRASAGQTGSYTVFVYFCRPGGPDNVAC